MAIFDPPPHLPHCGFACFFERDPPMTRGILYINGYLTAGCLRHKQTLVIIVCYHLWKKYGTMLISQYKWRTGKEKVIAKEEKGRRRPEKDAHL